MFKNLKNKTVISAIIIAFSLLISTSGANSQLLVETIQQGSFDSDVNTDYYPRFNSYVRASDQGKKIILTKKNVLIMEDNFTAIPESVGAPNGQGYQKVEWITTLRSRSDTAGTNLDLMYITVTANNKTGMAIATYRLPSVTILSIVSLVEMKPKIIYELDFGDLPVGQSTNLPFNLSPQAARKENGNEVPFPVDSIVMKSNNFSYFDVDGPPFMMTSPMLHYADIIFVPKTANYIRENITVYYEGGRKLDMPIIGQHYDMARSTMLNVIQPNGGEKLTPCQYYRIKWSGFIRGMTTLIEYTTDQGANWNKIAAVSDSVFDWLVPNVISDNVKIRVSQLLQDGEKRTLTKDEVPNTKVCFNTDASKLLSATRDGRILEWNLLTYDVDFTYKIGQVDYPGEATDSKGLIYFEQETKFVAAYDRFYMYPYNDPDTLAFFNVGSPDPYMKIGVDYQVKEISSDSKRQFIVVTAEMDNKIYLYSTTDGSLVKTIDFTYPVTTINFNQQKDEAIVVLLNNDVIVLDVPAFNIKSTFSYNQLPRIIKAALSSNGLYFSFGCKIPEKPEYVGLLNEIHVALRANGTIVRSFRKAGSNPVNLTFSPTSNILVLGYEGQPQISFWDLSSSGFAGGLQGNEGFLTDMKVSAGGNAIAATSFTTDNLTLRKFSYPEMDLSDNSFAIVKPDVDVLASIVPEKYIGSDNLIQIDKKFCNKGVVPILIDNADFQFGKHFRLAQPIINDTLFPGECLSFDIVYHPVDTGIVRDTLRFYSCAGTFLMPFESYSKMRNVSFLSDPFDFGELCVGLNAEKDFMFIRNDDPVAIKINYITFEIFDKNPFYVAGKLSDTIVQPGQVLQVRLGFAPQLTGIQSNILVVTHSDLGAYQFKGNISGRGIGTDIKLSHTDLRFIPEIKSRTINVKNLSDNTISIIKANISPFNNYKFVTPLPIQILGNSEANIQIDWDGVPTADDSLYLEAEPCVRRSYVILGQYKGQSTLSIPDVQADPNGEATIKVRFQTNENSAYNGDRFFESEITINPRIFLPQTVTSEFGNGTLIRNDVVNDRRIIGFRVEGNFPTTGIVADIKGIAGLAEIDTSVVRIVPQSLNWGTAVATTTQSGIFRLINLCGDRRIIQPTGSLKQLSISPNPSSGLFRVSFYSESEGIGSIDVIDNLGLKIMSVSNLNIVKGFNEVDLLGNLLSPGTYTVIVKLGSEFISQQIIIIK
jgi:WD40 repeat protein